jgi:anti-sigma factor RsiW
MTMECRTAHPLLEAYLDGELDRADARAVEAHLDTCAESREQLTRLDDLRRSLRDPSLRHTAPESLRRRIEASAIGLRRAPHAPRWMSYAAACVLAFAAGGTAVYVLNGANAEAQVTRDLFASHWRALAATSPIDVVSTDRHTVKPWFAGKVAQTPVVQDFADRGFALIGGRIDYVGAERVPVLVYKHGQHVIDVFVLPSGASIGSAAAQGYQLDAVNLGGQPAAVVSDMDAVETEKFAVLLRGE